MTTHGFMGYERWPDNPGVSARPGEHRSTDIGDVLIGRDGRSLQIAADDGLHLKPIAPIDRIPSDAKWAPEEPRREARAREPPAEQEMYLGQRDPARQPASIRIEPGKDNALSWRDDHSFDIHDATGKIGHLAGYMGRPWSEKEFRVTHVEISEPGRRLSPGQWKGVLRGLGEQLPAAEYLGGNRTGEGGDLSPAYEKLVRLPPPGAGRYGVASTDGHPHTQTQGIKDFLHER